MSMALILSQFTKKSDDVTVICNFDCPYFVDG